ncbi:MAG: futalosine hydrolase [Thermodesulfobacteriota bacterium]
MILLVAATGAELQPAMNLLAGQAGVDFLESGVGLLETAVSVGERLDKAPCPDLVLNFGVAGAYAAAGLPLLHPCLASSEINGDFGICYGERHEPLPTSLARNPLLTPGAIALAQCQDWLTAQGDDFSCCPFATVNGVSASQRRGDNLAQLTGACCENMEGAAVARQCLAHGVEWLELRVISNQVEDRDLSSWRLAEAIASSAAIAAGLCRHLLASP